MSKRETTRHNKPFYENLNTTYDVIMMEKEKRKPESDEVSVGLQ